ncbi:uncharacterized protein LOC135484929 [Lineus longissimus]|uniref:uncharacterized protein LOC135484929 n=1 Tax=Lineus longissimus TaxID=88925 RepID=UPI00315CFF6F
MLAQYIEHGDVQGAIDIFNNQDIQDITISELVTDPDLSDESRMTAEILKIKKNKSRKPTQPGKASKLDKPYDRLILLRDIREGSLFYIMTETSLQSKLLFKVQNVPWVGATVGLFEPERKSSIKNVPTLTVEQPLLPLKPTMTIRQTRPYVMEYVDTMVPKAIFVTNADIRITKANIITGCGAQLCDGQHDELSPCPALVTEDINTRLLSCRITSATANISRVAFKSTNFTKLFLTSAAMKTTSTPIPMLEFRAAITNVLQHYATNNISWEICGWYKPGIKATDEEVQPPTFHITSVRPAAILEDAPLYHLPHIANPRLQVEIAVERPCQLRIGHNQRPTAARRPQPDLANNPAPSTSRQKSPDLPDIRSTTRRPKRPAPSLVIQRSSTSTRQQSTPPTSDVSDDN